MSILEVCSETFFYIIHLSSIFGIWNSMYLALNREQLSTEGRFTAVLKKLAFIEITSAHYRLRKLDHIQGFSLQQISLVSSLRTFLYILGTFDKFCSIEISNFKTEIILPKSWCIFLRFLLLRIKSRNIYQLLEELYFILLVSWIILILYKLWFYSIISFSSRNFTKVWIRNLPT